MTYCRVLDGDQLCGNDAAYLIESSCIDCGLGGSVRACVECCALTRSQRTSSECCGARIAVHAIAMVGAA